MKTDKRMLGVFVRAQVEFMYKAGRFATLYNRRLKRLGLSLGKRQTRKGKSLVVKFFRKFFQ